MDFKRNFTRVRDYLKQDSHSSKGLVAALMATVAISMATVAISTAINLHLNYQIISFKNQLSNFVQQPQISATLNSENNSQKNKPLVRTLEQKVVEEKRDNMQPAPAQVTQKGDEFETFEKEKRKELFNALTTPTLEGRKGLTQILAGLKRYYSYPDRFDPSKRIIVGPSYYLFEYRGIDNQHLFDFHASYLTPMPHSAAHDYIAASFWTFSETMRKRDEAGHSRFEMIFNSIREPKEDELRNLYRIYRMLPAFVRKDLEGKFQKAYDEADELFDLESESKLHLYRPKVFLLDRGGYDSGFPKKPSEKIGIRRAADTGEMLASHEDTPEGTCKGLIFNSSIERKYSPFGKFLFRRGERFTGNLNKMVSAYKSTNNENGFINGLNRYFMLK